MASKEEVTKDPSAPNFRKKESTSDNEYSGCKLSLTKASHCEQDFGPQLAINGIANNNLDFYCSNFHPNGYPWILGSLCLLLDVLEMLNNLQFGNSLSIFHCIS